jgi:hypothetical protein
MLDFWRAILIVQKEDLPKLDISIQRLHSIGITTIHLFVQAGLRISQRFDHAPHQDPEWDNPYKLWKGATTLAGKIYSSTSELFLVSRPGCYYWEQLPTYCEYHVDRTKFAVWSPHTPTRVFPSENITRPRCVGSFGWCETQVHADVEAHHCFVVSGHTLSLIGAYLPENPDGAAVGCSIAYELGRRRVPYMFHLPSLVQHEDQNFHAMDFVGVSFHMNQSDMRAQNFILAPCKNQRC